VIEVHDNLEAVEAEWDDLCDRIDASPFLRPGYLGALARADATREPLVILALREGGRLRGLVPPLRRRGLALRTLRGHHTPFGLVAEDEAVAERLAHELFRRFRTALVIGKIDTAEPHLATIRRAAAARRATVQEVVIEQTPVIEIDDWDAYLSGLSRDVRRSVRRRRRRLEELGEVSIGTADSRGLDLGPMLDELIRVEGSGWKGRVGTAMACRPERARFHREVYRWATERGWLRIGTVRVDGTAIAMQLSLVHGDVWHLHKTAHDERYRRFGPGSLMMLATLEHAVADGARRIDLGGEADPYKLVFTDTCHDIVRFIAVPPSAAGAMFRARSSLVRVLGRVSRGRGEASTRDHDPDRRAAEPPVAGQPSAARPPV
jgi:CelD/BcsL family acetyltransferase involved in cellulose biosynthesis